MADDSTKDAQPATQPDKSGKTATDTEIPKKDPTPTVALHETPPDLPKTVPNADPVATDGPSTLDHPPCPSCGAPTTIGRFTPDHATHYTISCAACTYTAKREG